MMLLIAELMEKNVTVVTTNYDWRAYDNKNPGIVVAYYGENKFKATLPLDKEDEGGEK